MSRIPNVKELHKQELERHCLSNDVNFESMQRLLDQEKTKKLLKRNALIQQTINREIDNAIEDENK